MKRMSVALIAVVCCAGAIPAQQYFEASGQTKVGEFKPGVKIGPTAVHRSAPGSRATLERALTVSRGKNSVAVSFANKRAGAASIVVYDIRGKLLMVQHGSALESFRIDTDRFAAGIYHIEAFANGNRSSSNFMITR
ncbi:MAG: T9SS type A sorting domain-containing protein [Chitinispirillaceae bacterium]|jgi:hypothetical protein|nr:T9SS type A sorting domain-containing protein [Chitinispirillaceae bacterium]